VDLNIDLIVFRERAAIGIEQNAQHHRSKGTAWALPSLPNYVVLGHIIFQHLLLGPHIQPDLRLRLASLDIRIPLEKLFEIYSATVCAGWFGARHAAGV